MLFLLELEFAGVLSTEHKVVIRTIIVAVIRQALGFGFTKLVLQSVFTHVPSIYANVLEQTKAFA